MTVRSAGALATAVSRVVREGSAHGARARLVRAAAHLAAWSPFPISVADSFGRAWHAVGDGGLIGLSSWLTFSRHLPLVGQPTVLPGGPHDLGPAEFWLLALPVRLDPQRGQVWGAALLCMVAASVAIEAAWAVLSEAGGLLASGVIVGLITWMPALPDRPYWNPYFGAMWFVAALATAWAVMSGHRKWWPVLVICASLAAQAHLMYAAASVLLALVALGVAIADELKAKTGRRWLIAGLFAGEVCWLAPLDQQFAFPPGNMSALAHALTSTRSVGLTFAMKDLSAFAEPPALWWQRHLAVRPHLGRAIEARPAGFAIAVVLVTALVLMVAVVKLRSRRLASLAAISLVADTAALITFSGIPAGDLGRLNYLILVMFPIGLLAWLTAGSATLLVAWKLITSRSVPGRLATCWAVGMAAVLVVLASLHDGAQASSYPGAGLNAAQVAFADRLIERKLPVQRVFVLSVISDVRAVRYRIRTGLRFALIVQGRDPEVSGPRPVRLIPRVVVLIKGSKVTVEVRPGLRLSGPKRAGPRRP